MVKKHRREDEETIAEESGETLPVPEEIRTIRLYSEKLATIRAGSIQAQVDTAHTIAELEALRADIDATLAVLRSQRK